MTTGGFVKSSTLPNPRTSVQGLTGAGGGFTRAACAAATRTCACATGAATPRQTMATSRTRRASMLVLPAGLEAVARLQESRRCVVHAQHFRALYIGCTL